MGRKKQFIENLSIEELATLKEGYKNSPRSDFRRRCQVVLLSHKGIDSDQISAITDLSKVSVYKTLGKWRTHGISSLIRRKGQGRRPLLDVNNAAHVEVVEKQVSHNPQKIEQLIPSIVEQLGVEPFSKWTLKRFLKSVTTAGNDSDAG